MKINSVHLASFGKFKNYTLDFSDGFNTIFGENEKGKTTIMNFIRMMFYGNSGKSSDIDKNLRKKYMPFDSDLMAGSISFTHDGISYTLERVFKASNTGDKLKLINHNTGKIETLSGKNDIGSKFFGLSDSAFEKSVFIGNLSVFPPNDEANGELNSRLSNIITSLDEDVSLESVKARLIKAKELLMSRSGRIGIYDKAKQKLADTEELFKATEEREIRILSIQSEIAEKQARQAVVSATSTRLFELLKNAKMLSLKSALEKFLDSCKTVDSLEEKIRLKNGNAADKEFLEELKSAALQANQTKNDLENKQTEAKTTAASLEQLQSTKDTDTLSLQNEKKLLEEEKEKLGIEIISLNTKISDIKTEKVSRKPKSTILLICLGCLLSLSGAGLGFIAKHLFALIPLGVIVLLLSIVFAKKVKVNSDSNDGLLADLESKKAKETEVSSKIESLNSAINSILIESAGRKALIDAKTADLLQQKEAVLSAKEQEIKAEIHLNSVFSSIQNSERFSDVNEAIKEIEETLSRVSAEKIKLSLSYEQTGCSSKEEAESRLEKLNSDTKLNGMSANELETAQRRLKEISEEKNLLSADIAALNQELKNLLSSGETLSLLRLKIDKMKQELGGQKDFCDTVDFAINTLDEAFSELRHSFSHILEEKTAEIFTGLTGGAYTSVNVSKNFEIGVTARNSFGTKEWQYLSLGTAQQAYFSLRLALASLISEGGSPLPLLLDDSLSEYDDQRAETALNFLKEYSKNSQIILFTCHSGIADMAKNLDSDIKYL